MGGWVLPTAPEVQVKFRNLKTSQKLLAGFAVVTAFMVTVGLLGALSMRESSQRLEQMYEQNLVRLQHLADVISEYKDAATVLDLSSAAEDINEIPEDDEELTEYWDSYRSFDMTGREEL